jgi:hypothetical protein
MMMIMKRSANGTHTTKKSAASKEAQFLAKQLNAKAVAILPAIAKRLLPKGRIKGPYWDAPNPNSEGDTSEDLSIKLTDGTWQDFRTGEYGQTVLSFIVYLTSFELAEAESALSRLVGDSE